jgi:hypothetical protein
LRALKEKNFKPDADADGVRRTQAPGGGAGRATILAAAAAAVVLAIYLLLPSGNDSATAPAQKSAAGTAIGGSAPVAVNVTRRSVTARARRTGTNPGTTPPVAAPNRVGDEARSTGNNDEAEIDAADYIAALRESGETGGLAVFSPPGTRPAQTGVIVPDDYQLPEGFARHYQSSDDGGQYAAVLTLSPDYELIDENGDPIPLPQDRIVPPELAPPDLPLRMLEVPTASDRTDGKR